MFPAKGGHHFPELLQKGNRVMSVESLALFEPKHSLRIIVASHNYSYQTLAAKVRTTGKWLE